MADCKTDRARVACAHGLEGSIWLGGWLFTIGYLKLAFWKAVLGLVIWPYLLGTALR